MYDEKAYYSKSGVEIHAVFDTVKFGDLHMVKYATQRDVANIHVLGRVDAVGTAKGKRQTQGACVFTVVNKDRLMAALSKNDSNKVFLTNHELLNYGDGSATQTTDNAKLLKFGSRNRNTIDPDIALTALNAGSSAENSIFNINTYGASSFAALPDQIPPFDITLVGISESDPTAANRMIIHGVQFVSDQGGTSIDDLTLERSLSFLARRISPWTSLSDLASTSAANAASNT